MQSNKLLFCITLIFFLVINSAAWCEEKIIFNNSQAMIEDTEVNAKEKSIFDFFFKNESNNPSSSSIINEKGEVNVFDIDESTVNADITVLRVIDKTLGKLYKLEIPNNDIKVINELAIKAISCWLPPQKTLVSQGKALIEVVETRNRIIAKIFEGWIFAHAPALNVFSHPKYDIQLETCKILSLKNTPISK